MIAPLLLFLTITSLATSSGRVDRDVEASATALTMEIQQIIDKASALTGYSFSIGYVDKDMELALGSGPRSPPFTKQVAKGNVSGTDTMLMGSGTKPYTAAAIMRLVDQGVLTLDDPASVHIDPALKIMNGTTFVELFGPKAAKVTVGDIIRMQSGINDFDIPAYDAAVLESEGVWSPFKSLALVAAFQGEDGCTDFNCTFVCDPGTCTSYSSTNYILAGLILASHGKEGKGTAQSWTEYDQAAALGLDKIHFPNTHFLKTGPMNKRGLTTAGESTAYGPYQLWAQDGSVLGWSCGNVAASARDVAKFFWELLGPPASIVSQESLAKMKNFTTLNVGWSSGMIEYGGGLMWQNASPEGDPHNKPIVTDQLYSNIGHGGQTYAFMSDSGYYPYLNVSLTVIVNEDIDFNYPRNVVTCPIAQAIARHKGHVSADFHCVPPKTLGYVCETKFGQKTCVPTYSPSSMTEAQCAMACKDTL